MTYEVFARKWRPNQFEDVVGQAPVTETLTNAITTGRIAHAYLFVGPRGIGKTSIARILAKALNCAEGTSPTPCDKCDSCREIAQGTNLDVLEIDGASNNGVDQVRELRETVKFAPSHGPYKIYIIDEVHMLTVPAFNALLKTLEEPPSHVKFIFATTEPEKILATILSRCQRFDLRRIPVTLIVERLALIAKDEKLKVEEGALLAIARASEGGLRDAESSLDQMVSFRGREISEADVLSVFGLVARSVIESLARSTIEGDVRELVKQVSELEEAGKNLQRTAVELLGYFRNLLVAMHTDDAQAFPDLTPEEIDALKALGENKDTDRVLRVTDVLGETIERMKYALSRRILLETALIRCARASRAPSLAEVLRAVNAAVQAGGGAPGAAEKPAGERPKAEPAPPAPAASQSLPRKAKVREARPAHGDLDLEAVQGKWTSILKDVAAIAPLARAPLKDAYPVAVEGARVTVGFDPEFSDEVDNFKSGRNRKALEHVLRGMFGENVTVECVVAAFERPPQEKPQDKSDDEKMGWAGEPVVKRALDMFDGSIVDVRE